LPESPGRERVFYKGEGELRVTKIHHHGVARKALSFMLGGVIGYAIFGRDSKKQMKAKGMLVVTDKAIYCAGNRYPFNSILAMAVKGRISKSIVVELSSFAEGKTGELGGSKFTYEIEIKTKDVDRLFKALEEARMAAAGIDLEAV